MKQQPKKNKKQSATPRSTEATPHAEKKVRIASRNAHQEKEERVDISRPMSVRRSGGDGPARIKVVGIGGAGGNALSRMHDFFPRGVDLIAINTDLQDLQGTQARRRIYIGKQITKGLGAGMNPDIGKQAAEESREEIIKALEGADMVFLTAGFGGGTGSGATPVIAEIAQEMGILTIAVVTKPFSFEGTQRSQIAQEALLRLKDRVDTYITISNDKIFSVIDKDTTLKKAFESIDEVLKHAVVGVTELIMSPGIINVDFADIKTIVQNSGSSIIGVGVGSGKDRASAAAHAALASPLLESVIDGAHGVLFSISGQRDLKMSEIHEIARLISENVDPSARIIFGTYHDRKLNKGSVKVTLIATGFGASFGKNMSLFDDFESFSRTPTKSTLPSMQSLEESSYAREQKEEPAPVRMQQEEPQPTQDDAPQEESEELWDIPAFLRKKGKRSK